MLVRNVERIIAHPTHDWSTYPLRRWEAREEPGHTWEIAYPAYDSSDWQPIELNEG